MEVQLNRELEPNSVRADPARSDETIELLSIQADEDFNAQCQKCLTNLKRCVQMAERAAQVDVTLVRAIIQPLQNIVRDRHLRLAIWMSDCGITDGSLSRLAPKSISPLSDTLASLFERVHADVEGIFRGFCDLETVANQVAEADSRPNIPVHQVEVNREVRIRENIEHQCDDLTQCIYELAKLQDMIWMTLAIEDKGPEADLHKSIKKHKEDFSAEDNLSSTTADRASHSSGDEQCSECQKWFPAYALSLHEESCKEIQAKYGEPGEERTLEEALKDEPHVPAEPLSSQPPVGDSMLMASETRSVATRTEQQGDVGYYHDISAKDDSIQAPAEASLSEVIAKTPFSNTSAFFPPAAHAIKKRKDDTSPAMLGDDEPVQSQPPPQKLRFQESPLEEHPNYQIFQAATAGLRKRLIAKERRQKTEYQLFSIGFNLLSIAQVVTGAAITALGPSGGEHMLEITILGAFITSISGLLALLNGRGLPQRLRRNMTELAKVLNHIEEQTILLKYGNRKDSDGGIDALIEDALKRCAIAEDIIERNQPDTYAYENGSQPTSNATETEFTLSQRSKKSKARGKRRAADEEMGTDDLIHL